MFRAVVRLFGHWGVTDEQAAKLLDLGLRTYGRWRAGDVGRIGRDGKARLSNLMGIHKVLRLIFSEPARGYSWIGAPNDAFGGSSRWVERGVGQLCGLTCRHWWWPIH